MRFFNINKMVFSGLLILAVGAAEAGRLDDFEKKAGTKKKKESSSKKRSRHHSGSQSFSGYGSRAYPSWGNDETFLGSILGWMLASRTPPRPEDVEVYASVHEAGGADAGEDLFQHQKGAATLPFLRVDYNYQYIDSHLDAEDFRVEAGYRMFALYGRHTRYMEHEPDDQLIMNQFYAMLRFGGEIPTADFPDASWEFGMGIGAVDQRGNQNYSGGALTVPIKFYPTDWLGLEFRPAWYKPQERRISDYDVSLSLGHRFLQWRAGYRWTWLQGDGNLFSGPYGGVSASF